MNKLIPFCAAVALLWAAPGMLMAADSRGAGPGDVGPVDLLIDGAPILGDPSARVTLIEYSDYQCPYCARHYRETLPLITTNYVETGMVRLVMRQFPIPNLQPRAAAAASAALCAGEQGRYWEMHGRLFADQKRMSDDDLRGYATEIGLDVASFDSCFAQNLHARQVESEVAEGNRIGVRGTPSFVLGLTDPANPHAVRMVRLIYGARNYDYFARAIDELLAAEGEGPATH